MPLRLLNLISPIYSQRNINKLQIIMKAITLLIAVLLSLNLSSQVVTSGPVSIQFVNLPAKIKEIKRCSLSIEKSDTNYQSLNLIGSGFLVKEMNSFYAVTNNHVVKSIGKDKILLVGFNADKKKQYASVVKTITDEKYDIAVLKLGDFVAIKNSSIDTTLANPGIVSLSLFETSDKIIEGDGVIIIGYPLGLGSEFTGNKPISRIGIIAQEPNSKTNTFLLDCIASHGNSGSPVFNEQTQKLVGMITSFKPDFINLYDDNGILKASFPDNSGIAICVTAEMIKKLILKIQRVNQ